MGLDSESGTDEWLGRVVRDYWRTVLGLLAAAGAVATIWTALAKQFPWTVAAVFFVMAIVALGFAIRASIRARIANRLYGLLDDAHCLVHEVRDTLPDAELLEAAGDEEQCSLLLGRATQTVLDRTAALFSALTRHQCTASLMTYATESKDELETVAWSNYAGPKRRESPTRLRSPHGLAWKAIREMKSAVYNDLEAKDIDFVGVRSAWRDEYKSAVVCPFRGNGVPQGVLNIDCKENRLQRKGSISRKQPILGPVGRRFAWSGDAGIFCT